MSLIPGTILAAKVSPGDTAASFATHEDIYGQGGLRSLSAVKDINYIPLARQKEGMIIYAQDTSTYYTLSSVGTPPGFKLTTVGALGTEFNAAIIAPTSLTDTGTVMIVTVNGVPYGLRLWNIEGISPTITPTPTPTITPTPTP